MELIVKGTEVKVLVGELEVGDVILCSGEFLMKVGDSQESESSLFINLTDIEEKDDRTSFDMLSVMSQYVGVVYTAVVSLEVKS